MEWTRRTGWRDCFRKFALMDCFLLSIAIGESQAEIKRLNAKVLHEKKDAQAEFEDLEKMEIPRLEEKKIAREAEERMFPLFTTLPPGIQRMILGYLTSASEKLNVMAVPDVAELTGWRIPDLKCEQVLSILLEKGRLYSQDILKLTQISRSIRDFLCSNFTRGLKISFAAGTGGSRIDDVQRFLQADGTVPLNPIPVRVRTHMKNEKQRKNVLRILQEIGENIWDCEFGYSRDYEREMSYLEIVAALRDCLVLMPNLKRVALFNCMFTKESALDEAAFKEIQFPELPQLECLEFIGICPYSKLEEKLLQKYGPSVSRINREISFLSSSHVQEAIRTEFPHLSTLRILIPCETYQDGRPFTDLVRFSGSPLRSLQVTTNQNHKGNCRYLFADLSKFGSTVENLHLHLWSQYIDESTSDMTWLASLRFPKVKRLVIAHCLALWTILLAFPAMETLTLKNGCSDNRRYFQSSGIISLSWNKEEMYVSNIWKLFPFLKTVNFVRRDHFGNAEEHTVSRNQCLVFEKKAAALPPTHRIKECSVNCIT